MPAWLGGWVFAARPPDSDLSDSQWLFTVKYENGDCEELELEELEAITQPAESPHHVNLYKTSKWKNFENFTQMSRRASALVTSTARIVLALETFKASSNSTQSNKRAPRKSFR